MQEVRVETIRHTLLQISLAHNLHALGIPHDQVRPIELPVMHRCHNVAIVLTIGCFGVCLITLGEENFATAARLSKVDQLSRFFLEAIEFEHTIVESVVFAR